MSFFLIDPQERLDFTLDWTSFLGEGGSPLDAIVGSSFTISPLEPGSTTEPALSGESSTPVTATIFVSNCAVGSLYRLTNRIVTSAGRVAERSISLRGEQQ